MVRKLSLSDLALGVWLGIIPLAGCRQAEIVQTPEVIRQVISAPAPVIPGLKELDEIAAARYEYDVNVSGMKIGGIPVPKLTPATSTFTIRQLERENIGSIDFDSDAFPQIRNGLDELIAEVENKEGNPVKIVHLSYETRLRTGYQIASNILSHIIRLASDVSYQYTEEIAVETSAGLRPIRTMHRLKKGRNWITITETYHHGTNTYKRETSDGEATSTTRHIAPEIMRDAYGALTLRLALAQMQPVKGSKRIGYILGTEKNYPLVIRFRHGSNGNSKSHDKTGILELTLKEYAGIENNAKLIALYGLRLAQDDSYKRVYASDLTIPISFKIGATTATFVHRRE